MPGKYDPDGRISKNPERSERKLPLLNRFLTDEEWYQSENYKILREIGIKSQSRKNL